MWSRFATLALLLCASCSNPPSFMALGTGSMDCSAGFPELVSASEAQAVRRAANGKLIGVVTYDSMITYTLEGHPAHPAITRRRRLPNMDPLDISGCGFGDEAAFRKLYAQTGTNENELGGEWHSLPSNEEQVVSQRPGP